MLSYANMAIDAVQNSKTQFLSTFVKEESVRDPLQAFVNSQTSFAKQIVKTTQDLWTAAQEADYTKLFKAGK